MIATFVIGNQKDAREFWSNCHGWTTLEKANQVLVFENNPDLALELVKKTEVPENGQWMMIMPNGIPMTFEELSRQIQALVMRIHDGLQLLRGRDS